MTEYKIEAGVSDINFAPANVAEEVIQNVRTILSTPKGSVVHDREFGIDWGFLDAPVAVAKASFSTQIITALKKYEPRAKVIKISLEETTVEESRFVPITGLTQTDKVAGSKVGYLKPTIVIGVIE